MSQASASISFITPPAVPFPFPVKGYSETWARSNQPPLTTPDCMNVMPYDLTGRSRGGVRPGTVDASGTNNKYYLGNNGTNANFCQWMQQVTAEVGTNSAYANVYRYVNTGLLFEAQITRVQTTSFSGGRGEFITLFAGGEGWFGTSSSSLAQLTGGTGGTNGTKINSASFISGAVLNGVQYLVDGSSNIACVSFTTTPPQWVPFVTIAGTSPAATGPRVVCVYRKRLVVGGGLLDTQPQNFYGSRVGAPGDFDYSKADPGAPWAGNASKAGQPGEAIMAMIPLGDDALIIGCDRSIWIMNGDIADGGRIDVLTRGVGMVSSTGYCFDPSGNLYFVGNNGFYRMANRIYTLEDLSLDQYPSFFTGALPSGRWSCVYDKDRHGIWIFRQSFPQPNSGPTHLWYDLRTGGFFPQQFPANFGPTSAMQFEVAGNIAAREVLMAGYGSNSATAGLSLYKLDPTAANDGGTAISAYAWFGPVRPSGDLGVESILIETEFVLGETPAAFGTSYTSATYKLQAGRSDYDAYANPHYTAGGSFSTAGRQQTVRNRVRGESFMIKLSNTNAANGFDCEQIAGRFLPAGRVRV